jgi:hypothetical protein
MRYARRSGISETVVGEDLFLADPASGELYHLDASARGLWTVLAEPVSFETIRATFREAFPDADPERMERDLRQALATLMARGLAITVL